MPQNDKDQLEPMENKIKGVAFKFIVKTSEQIKETEKQGTAKG